MTSKLYKHSIYREYKISSLVEECGYASTKVFVSAFKKEHNMTPSSFIEWLKNEITSFE
ncbi:hypothetical protein CMT37_09110 [Elizabethkingia anophelis]|nr:hypothetical protein [Elizabethkingia anophelis]